MRRSGLGWLISLLFVVTMLTVGCGAPDAAPATPPASAPAPPPAPEPGVTPVERPADLTRNLRWLTEKEKARVIDIAMNTPEAKEAKERYGVYRTGLKWVAIKKNESGGKSLWGLDYEMVDNIPENVPIDAKFYSQAEIYFGEPEQRLMRIAVDLDTGEIVDIQRHGLKILPR